MNKEATNETRVTIAHPNGRGTGSAVRISLHPASGIASGYATFEIARQKTAELSPSGYSTFATFDWGDAITVKMCVSDLAQMLMVFRGQQESIADGKGLFHRSATANAVIKFSHVIEPRPGYCLEVSRRPFDGELFEAFIVFRPEEALWLSLALEGAMPALVFGVPAVMA
jgi:hypothetical protein